MVSGVAAGVATAAAVPEVRKIFSGAATARAIATVLAYRTVTPPAQPVVATAAASGRAHGQFFAKTPLDAAIASANGYAQADFFAAGDAQAYLTPAAVAYRRTRARPLAAWGYGNGEAEGFVYQLAYGAPARATAKGLGTTYHVGAANVGAFASGTAASTAFIGGKSAGLGTADATASMLRTAGAQGQGAASAVLAGDAAITRNGVREFEVVGSGAVTASAQISTTTIYQLQTLACAAMASGSALQQFGGKGAAYAKALLAGDGLLIVTGVTGVTGLTHVSAVGKGKLHANAKGAVAVSAKAHAGAVHTFGVQSAAVATATASHPRVELRVRAELTATARAVAAATTRIRTTSGAGDCAAAAVGFNLVNEAASAPLSRTHNEGPFSRLVIISSEVRLLAA